ncbi:MAG TPA: PEP/pyruvate-binding domain-containing protein, partial [Polyangiaceae bacterium]
SDYDALASTPLSASIPGAVSVKVVFDTRNGEKLYFQNSKLYQIHYEFASTHLSVAQGMPDVGTLPVFNQTEYSSPSRHFILGAVTYYEGPKYWALELAPYDTADATMVERLYRAVKANAYFGGSLVLHPTSNLGESITKSLPADVHVKSTAQIFAGIDYQPLNVSQSVGTLRFVSEEDLKNAYFSFRDIVVLEAIPGDISVTAGIITADFQTPLSHINVLSMNRGTPNMGLRGAMTNEKLRALAGKPVRLIVGAEDWSVTEVTQAESDAWWAAHKPKPIDLPPADLSVTDLRNIEDVVDEASAPNLFQAITKATYAFGAKAANYSILAKTPGVPVRKAFGVPIYYYMQFMQENGFDQQVKAMLADPEFQESLPVQELRLAQLRTAILNGKVNKAFETLLKAKLKADYGNQKMRFRTSTNAEDLNGFPCAGCYDSHSGDPSKWDGVLLAIKETWSGVWFYRTFREREYNGIDHLKVGMGLLVHHNFDEEEANGVAVTQNIFVPSGLDPAYYINVQWGGDSEVVNPDPGTTSDEFLFYLRSDGDSVVSISHSNLIPATAGRDTVLSARQVHNLGLALNEIHKRFDPAYGFLSGNTHWYAMDVEFKFDNELAPDKEAQLYIKQARPYPDPSK